MTKQLKVGLIYINDPGWSGGTDYVINLMNSLPILSKQEKPYIRLFIENTVDLSKLKPKLLYPDYEICRVQVSPSKVWRLLRKLGIKTHSDHSDLDIIYPFPKKEFYQAYFSNAKKSSFYYWIPDFQEQYFPEFFSESELIKRKRIRSEILYNPNNHVVFSSHAALNDMKTYYPFFKASTTVLRFANPSGISFSNHNPEKTLEQYDVVKQEYYICPNQFWRHKNHQILVEVASILKSQGKKVNILLTGKEEDSRDKEYFPKLKAEVEQKNLTGEIRFLGFIPKHDLYTLMVNAKAMIQPSLFEGWSTTIEDAITLNVPVICSNIDVNREQLGDAALYFDPRDPLELSNILRNTKEYQKPNFNIEHRVREFAQSFMKIAQGH